jgi:hypothetical protein
MRHAKAEAESVTAPRRGAQKANETAGHQDAAQAGAGPQRDESKDANDAATGKGQVRGSDSLSAASTLYGGSDLVPLSASVGGTVGSDGAAATIANSTPVVPLPTAVTGSTIGVGSALDATSLAASRKNARK